MNPPGYEPPRSRTAGGPIEEEIFQQAVLLSSAEERRCYLVRACDGDETLRNSLEALLGCHDRASGFNFLPAEVRTASVASLDRAPDWEGPGAMIGRYRLLGKIGEGGFGVVYLAEQREPVVRQVALKIIKLGMDTRAVVTRFEAERQALAMMDHPGIAQVFDGGATDTGRPYFVMERVIGSRITEFCETHRLTTRERVELFIKVCHAVQHAHQKGVIHRDLKPSNILVAHSGGPVSLACPKVIDFGIAKATEARLADATVLTQGQILMGTPAYMSPEQAEPGSTNIDTRSDVYSLGVLLYELLTGRTPFDSGTARRHGLDAWRRLIREVEPAKPSTCLRPTPARTDPPAGTGGSVRAEEVRGDLDWIVMKCLEKDRSRRYATVNGLAFDLDRHLRDVPVEARPPSSRYRLAKWVRRNRGLLAALTSILVLLVAGVITSSLLAVRAVRAEGAERELRRRADAARESARLQAYAADMQSAGAALQANDPGRVIDLLERHVPRPGLSDLRGLEWRYLWKATRGEEYRSFTLDRWINCARLSPDGTLLACAVFGGGVRLLDPETGRERSSFAGTGEKYAYENLAFSPDGRWLASASAEGVVIRETTGWKVVQSWPGNADAVAFSPDGRFFVWTDDTGSHFFGVSDWRSHGVVAAEVPGMVRLAFSPDSRRVAVIRRPLPKVELIDLETFQSVATKGGVAFPLSVGFSPDGKWLAAGNSDGDIAFWEVDGDPAPVTWKAHARYVFGLGFSPDGTLLASGGGDQLVHLWDLSAPSTNGFARRRTLRGHRNEIWSLAFAPSSRSLISAGRDATVKVWDTSAAGTAEAPLSWSGGGGISLGFVGDSRRYVRWTMEPPRLEVWDPWGRSMATNWPLCPTGAVVLAGTRLYFGNGQGEVESWKLPGRDGDRRVRLIDSALRAVQGSEDGWLFVGWDRDAGLVSVWNLETGARLAELPDFAVPDMSPSWSIPQRAALTPDGSRLAYAAEHYSVKIRDLAGKRAEVVLNGHVWHLQTLRFSPDGRRLVTAGWDGIARVWDPQTGRELTPPLEHRTGIASIAFSAEGRSILTLGGDTQLHFWIAATGDEALTVPAGAAWFAHLAASDDHALAWDVGDGSILGQFHRLPTLAEIDALAAPKTR